MARLFIFAIGGTGARVVRSLTMMVASGIHKLDSDTEIVPIIIDHDVSNGDKTRALNSLKCYSQIHSKLYAQEIKDHAQKFEDHYFMTNIVSLNHLGTHQPCNKEDFEWRFQAQASTSKRTFAQEIGYSSMGGESPMALTHDLIESQYDDSAESSPDAELNLDLQKGFKGNPNIGTVVFHKLRTDPVFIQFALNFRPDDKIFIISSIFGGTGSAGFPAIVNAIRESAMYPNLQDAQIGAAVVLPYFKLQPMEQAAKDHGDTGAIHAEAFNAKAKTALGAYEDSINKLVNTIYYIGQPDEERHTYTYNEGCQFQVNPSNIVEFIAATAIVDFIVNPDGVHVDPTIAGHKPQHPKAIEFAADRPKTGRTSIDLTCFDSSMHNLILSDLTLFAAFARYYREVLKGDRKQIADNETFVKEFQLTQKIGKAVFADIEAFLGEKPGATNLNNWGFYQWMDELSKEMKLYNLRRTDANNNKDDLRRIYAHKVISVTGSNPMKDSEMTSAINIATKNGPYTDIVLLKAIRDVLKNKLSKLSIS